MDKVFERNHVIVFSVIMPCYNSSAYVRDAVDSLLAQSYPHWILVAINDGSEDDTLQILNEYSQKDTRITVYSKENGGYATAVNYGLDKIDGDYFLMMGSDDRLAPNLFERIVANIEDQLPDMIAFRAVKYLAGKAVGLDSITSFDSAVSMYATNINEYIRQYPEHSQNLTVRDTAKCFRRKRLGDLRYFGKYGYDADGVFSCLFAHKCTSFMSLPIDGYLWTLREDSVSAKTNLKTDIDRMEVWIAYYQAIFERKDFEPTEQEKLYFSIVKIIAERILTEKGCLPKETNETILAALKKSIVVAKKYGVNFFDPNERLERLLFLNMPKMWMAYVILQGQLEKKKR